VEHPLLVSHLLLLHPKTKVTRCVGSKEKREYT